MEFLKAMQLDRQLMTLAWSVCGVFAAIDCVWFPFSDLSFATSNVWLVGRTALLLLILALVPKLIERRVHDHRGRFPEFLKDASGGFALFIRVGWFSLVFSIFTVTFAYLAARRGMPLRDADLAAIDQSLGFHWLDVVAQINSSELLSAALVVAYHSAGPQLVVLLLLLSYQNNGRRLAELLALLSVTLLVTAILFALVPAAGAYAFFRPAKNLVSNFTDHAGMWHYEFFIRLRAGEAPIIDLAKIQGMVTFPSFHTILAIVTAYIARGIRYIAKPALLLNGIVIMGTVPEGGHHLIDVLAGGVIAVTAIYLVRAWVGQPAGVMARQGQETVAGS